VNAIRLQSRCLLFVALLAATPSTGELLFAPTPHKSLGQTRRLLDAVDVRVMLSLGYEMAPELVRTSELARRRGVVEVRVYVSGKERIELGLSATPRGTYDIVVYRQGEGGLDEIERRLQDLVGRANRASSSQSEPDLGYEMIRLGHIEADRTLALLKALGYYTIAFNPKGQGSEKIFDLVRGKSDKLPWIVKVTNASKTSLMAPGAKTTTTRSSSSSSKGGLTGVLQLGGSHLHSATAGAPEERLLIVYDRDRPEDLETLVNLLHTHIDVPAQQIVIEALVIEVNSTSLNDLGFEWSSSNRGASANFERGVTGTRVGSFLLSPGAFTDFNAFRGAIEALQEKGDAEILSSPSVLVLNDRQARIQVGRQIPVSRTTATTSATIKGVEYFPIGIVLNLRPRINRERSEVTMQIEAIISSISPESAAKLEASAGDITFSPIVDNRHIQTYVRVADGTPFIIGGLLSTDDQTARISLPLFSSLPLIGRLFTRVRVEHERTEVIVVLTPHIVPQDARNFSYLIPKDSDIFDRFDYTLFRNAYRVRDDEVWDLKFIQDSPVLRSIVTRIRGHAEEDVTIRRREPFASFLAGNIPGEEVLVRRMLKDIVEKLEYGEKVDVGKVFFFETAADDNLMDRGLNSVLGGVLETPGHGLVLTYNARDEPKEGEHFTYPFATVRDTVVPEVISGDDTERVLFLRGLNPVGEEELPLQWSILLADDKDLAHLRNVLVLKRLMDLNSKLPQTLKAFQPGVQILFPSREDMANRYHLIDKEVAQLFYETSASQYYPAFERVFNRRVREVERILGPGGRR
jgi:Flp pilus assembly secretin CpaC